MGRIVFSMQEVQMGGITIAETVTVRFSQQADGQIENNTAAAARPVWHWSYWVYVVVGGRYGYRCGRAALIYHYVRPYQQSTAPLQRLQQFWLSFLDIAAPPGTGLSFTHLYMMSAGIGIV